MPLCDANTEEFEGFEIFGRAALFTNARINRDTLPKGVYAYDLRHGDSGARPCTVENRVIVNHFGTVLLNSPIALSKDGYRKVRSKDYNFTGDAKTLADYMREHPPKHKAQER